MIDDDEIDDAPITRVLVSAKDAPPPAITAPRSVFELASVATHAKHGSKANGGVKFGQAKYRKVQLDGRTVNIGIRYPADRMTTEKAQAEEARRAKQRPPKPTRGYKTISKKFQTLVS
ncbi:MAG: hypothetical protein KBG00_07900 [Rhodoferax sp.]|jgi:hypothetical protein|uniref:hypothetical protein n=1 Tax=Rhodoferax sp. TaxID=50421 RepID=UPI001B574616|nr:hypothetical protein [Rhodoferax sp.]MBP9148691.1 hypothetical protein [Rhodoferax sp.]MBP9736275.1 hypothetical protein [Rhodoferax sp.]